MPVVPGYGDNNPLAIANRVTADASCNDNLRIILERCLTTVLTLLCILAAICLLV